MMNKNSTDEANQPDRGRREFLMKIALGVAGVSAIAASVPVLASFFAPLLERPPGLWRPVAGLEGFEVGATRLVSFENAEPEAWAGTTARTAAWLRRDAAESFTAFSANCTHLGCPVRWESEAHLFMCPCHGGAYYPDGSVAAGPPPKPLVRYSVRVNNGNIEIRTSSLPITTIGE
jgi:menaquinol-cytochrome c reductase iron-sulfur subunit